MEGEFDIPDWRAVRATSAGEYLVIIDDRTEALALALALTLQYAGNSLLPASQDLIKNNKGSGGGLVSSGEERKERNTS